MRDSNKDLRIIRTRSWIRNALVELIEEKGFEAITVKDITTRAKINRGTFYAHYQDKYDLMTKSQEEIMYELSAIIKRNLSATLAEIGTATPNLVPLSTAVTIFEYLNDNSGFMKAVLGPKGDLTFQTKIKEFIWKTLFNNSADSLIQEEDLLVPGHYLTSYVASAHIGVIQEWLNRNTQESPQEMARILSTITMNGPVVAAGLIKRD